MRLLPLLALFASAISECGRPYRACFAEEGAALGTHIVVEGYSVPAQSLPDRFIMPGERVPCEELRRDTGVVRPWWEAYRLRVEDPTIATFANGLIYGHRVGRTFLEASLPTGGVVARGEIVVLAAPLPFPPDASVPPMMDASLDADR